MQKKISLHIHFKIIFHRYIPVNSLLNELESIAVVLLANESAQLCTSYVSVLKRNEA